MKKISYLLLLFSVLFMGTSAKFSEVSPENSKVRVVKVIKVKNTTNFNIDEIYISSPDEDHWGSDLLDPDEVLMPNEIVEIEVDCGTWDVKLVAEDNSTCEIDNINLCASAQWNIVANCN
jgi:hypothetical protein